MQVAYLVNNSIHLSLKISFECLVEPFDITRLGMADAADELEDEIKEKEAKIKSKTTAARAERRSKLADKADK